MQKLKRVMSTNIWKRQLQSTKRIEGGSPINYLGQVTIKQKN